VCAALADLALLDINTDPHTDDVAWGETLMLADRFRLSLNLAPKGQKSSEVFG
jgi:hypothetical protein